MWSTALALCCKFWAQQLKALSVPQCKQAASLANFVCQGEKVLIYSCWHACMLLQLYKPTDLCILQMEHPCSNAEAAEAWAAVKQRVPATEASLCCLQQCLMDAVPVCSLSTCMHGSIACQCRPAALACSCYSSVTCVRFRGACTSSSGRLCMGHCQMHVSNCCRQPRAMCAMTPCLHPRASGHCSAVRRMPWASGPLIALMSLAALRVTSLSGEILLVWLAAVVVASCSGNL